MNLIDELRQSKVIPAVKDEETLVAALRAKSKVIFLLKSEIGTAKQMVDACHKAGKLALIHFDLLEGLSSDDAAMKFLATHIKPDGIISTKNNLIKIAKQYNLFSVFRVFLLDSHSVSFALGNALKNKSDAVEILPGIIPKMVKYFVSQGVPNVITGGLIDEQEDIDAALSSGALCCSTSNTNLWEK